MCCWECAAGIVFKTMWHAVSLSFVLCVLVLLLLQSHPYLTSTQHPLCSVPAGNLKDLLTAAQLSGNVPRTVNSSSNKDTAVFDPAADPKKSKDSQKIREKVRERQLLCGAS